MLRAEYFLHAKSWDNFKSFSYHLLISCLSIDSIYNKELMSCLFTITVLIVLYKSYGPINKWSPDHDVIFFFQIIFRYLCFLQSNFIEQYWQTTFIITKLQKKKKSHAWQSFSFVRISFFCFYTYVINFSCQSM